MIQHVCGCVCRAAADTTKATAPLLGTWPGAVGALLLVLVVAHFIVEILIVTVSVLAVVVAVLAGLWWLRRRAIPPAAPPTTATVEVHVTIAPAPPGGVCLSCGRPATAALTVADRTALTCPGHLASTLGGVGVARPALERGIQ